MSKRTNREILELIVRHVLFSHLFSNSILSKQERSYILLLFSASCISISTDLPNSLSILAAYSSALQAHEACRLRHASETINVRAPLQNLLFRVNHIPIFLTPLHQASLAQLVERGTSNAEVTGSTPLGGSSLIAWSLKTMSNILLVLLSAMCF
jgi:hypothetical protein